MQKFWYIPCLELVVHYSVQVPHYNPVKFAPWLNVVGRAKKALRGKLLIVCSWSAAKYLRHLFSSFRKFCQINQMKKMVQSDADAMITQLVSFLALVFDLTEWSDSFRTFQVFPLEPRLIFSPSKPQAWHNEAHKPAVMKRNSLLWSFTFDFFTSKNISHLCQALAGLTFKIFTRMLCFIWASLQKW